jgi:hypothetical protein
MLILLGIVVVAVVIGMLCLAAFAPASWGGADPYP